MSLPTIPVKVDLEYNFTYTNQYGHSSNPPKSNYNKSGKIGPTLFTKKEKTHFKIPSIQAKGLITNSLFLKWVFMLVCCGLCCYQIIYIFQKYFAYPMSVNVIVDEMKILKLPSITICNNNIMQRNLFWDMFPDKEELANNSLKEINKYVKEFLKTTPLSKIIDWSPINKYFITEMLCDQQFNPDDKEAQEIKCNKIEIITSLQKNGICFTYFFKMAKFERVVRACEELGNCFESKPLFATNEIIRFELDFKPQDYTNKDLPISGMISIHDNSEIGNSLSNAYNLEPGYYYQFFIKKTTTSMLPNPYSTDCVNYYENNFKKLNESRDFTTIPLSRRQCADVCLSSYIVDKCKCWPPELLYIKHNQLDANKSLGWCAWKFTADALEVYGACNDPTTRMNCAVDCKANCVSDNYEISVQKLPFEYYPSAEDKGWNSENKEKVKCCAVVSIRYGTTEHTIHEYSPLFKLLDMICYVGGLVSMYTGLSFIAVYDYITITYYFVKKHM